MNPITPRLTAEKIEPLLKIGHVIDISSGHANTAPYSLTDAQTQAEEIIKGQGLQAKDLDITLYLHPNDETVHILLADANNPDAVSTAQAHAQSKGIPLYEQPEGPSI